MDKKRFKWCCGTAEIGGFYAMNKDDCANTSRLKELEEMIKDNRIGAVICTTNGEQPRSASCLKRNNYTVILTFINPNTNNPVTIWLKDLTKEV